MRIEMLIAIANQNKYISLISTVALIFKSECLFIINLLINDQHFYKRSVPIFWEQRSILDQVKINCSFENTNSSFLKHFEDINKNYSFVLCVNLMKRTKEKEEILTERFEFHIKNNNLGTFILI